MHLNSEGQKINIILFEEKKSIIYGVLQFYFYLVVHYRQTIKYQGLIMFGAKSYYCIIFKYLSSTYSSVSNNNNNYISHSRCLTNFLVAGLVDSM